MNKLVALGIFLILLGIWIGAYVGLYQCFFNGTVNLIDIARSHADVSSSDIVKTILRVLVTVPVLVAGWFSLLGGLAIISESSLFR